MKQNVEKVEEKVDVKDAIPKDKWLMKNESILIKNNLMNGKSIIVNYLK